MIEILAEEAMRCANSINLDAIEVFLQKKNLKRVEITGGVIKNIIEQERTGIALRSIMNNQLSFVSSNSVEKIQDMVELSAQNAQKSMQKIDQSFVNKKYITPVQQIRDSRLIDLTLDDLCDRLEEILSSIKQSKPVKNLDGTVSIETEERLIANSEDLWKREVGTRLKANIWTTIKMGDFIGVGSGYLTSRILTDNWQKMFNTSIQTAISQQGRRELSIGKPKGFILSPQAAAKILAFGMIPSFSYTSGSSYSESFRNCRFNKNLQFIDDPSYSGAQNTFGWDDEGYPSKPRIVVSGGKCRRLLGMNFSCFEKIDRELIRGNCYRASFSNLESRSYTYPPTVMPSNFIIKQRKHSSKDLVQELTNGIYIKEITGAQDTNYYTGDFIFSIIEGYEINNGEITNPILPCYCSGNIYRIIEDPNLLLGSILEEVIIPATPLTIIMPELLTSKIMLSI
ncbi:MAG: TldD/PmbA family protein [Asgard group archaeon]|nr:TldD/PmbA family protein [Asgard group archaeon]